MSVLAPLLSIYTIYLFLALFDFFLKEKFELPEGMDVMYLALLGAYAADKEIRRCIGIPGPSRRGSVVVYIWCSLFVVFYVLYALEPSYKIPSYVMPVTLQVLAIFFGTGASKQIYS